MSCHCDREMSSPYLDQPLVPLAVALPQMVEQIEAELVGKKLAGADQRHLRQRVELIRWLLTPPDNLATTGELAGLAPPFLPRQCSAWGTGRKSAIDPPRLMMSACPMTSNPSASPSAKPLKPATSPAQPTQRVR